MIQAARQLAAQTVNLTGVIVQGILTSGHAPSWTLTAHRCRDMA